MSIQNCLYPVLGVLSCFLAFCALSLLDSSRSQCVVYLTGHSISISGCSFTPEFIEYARGLDVLKL